MPSHIIYLFTYTISLCVPKQLTGGKIDNSFSLRDAWYVREGTHTTPHHLLVLLLHFAGTSKSCRISFVSPYSFPLPRILDRHFCCSAALDLIQISEKIRFKPPRTVRFLLTILLFSHPTILIILLLFSIQYVFLVLFHPPNYRRTEQ